MNPLSLWAAVRWPACQRCESNVRGGRVCESLPIRDLPVVYAFKSAGDGSPGGCARAWGWLRECGGRGVRVREFQNNTTQYNGAHASEREVCMVAFVCCCFACDCVLELVCRVRFARVSCPWLRFGYMHLSGRLHSMAHGNHRYANMGRTSEGCVAARPRGWFSGSL